MDFFDKNIYKIFKKTYQIYTKDAIIDNDTFFFYEKVLEKVCLAGF